MTWWLWLLVALSVWLLFNCLAPLSLLAFAEPMSLGRIPADILKAADAHKVKYFSANLVRGFAFTTWLGTSHAVVLSKRLLEQGYPTQIRFILAHELAHCILGHLRLRWLLTVTGLCLVPPVAKWFRTKEEEADFLAERLSGLPRSVLSDRRLASNEAVKGADSGR